LAAALLIPLESMMTEHLNPLGQQISFPMSDWTARPRPPRTAMVGRFCRIEPLDPDQHAVELFAANREDRDGRNWTYLPFGPFERLEEYRAHIIKDCLADDVLSYAIIEGQSGRAGGVATLMSIEPAMGVIELGIVYSPLLQRKPAATEAMYLMMCRVFDELGYRRYEWKCDALNAASRAAAARLGFRFEGIFRQATVYKGRNRDTAWFSVIDREWPSLKTAFEGWLDAKNFDEAGRQRRPLVSFAQA
jgi:RimJ/RimL family protein N-acetyltransferase